MVIAVSPVQGLGLVNLTPNVVLKTKFGQLTVINSQQYDMFALYANGTMFFNYTGFEDHIGHFAFTAQSYGNGSFVVRFQGAIPTQITQASATTVYGNGYEQITYTSSQTSALNVQFFTNPKFNLLNGLFIGAGITVAVIVIRIAYMVLASTPEERLLIMKKNQKIVIILMLMLFLLFFGATLFP